MVLRRFATGVVALGLALAGAALACSSNDEGGGGSSSGVFGNSSGSSGGSCENLDCAKGVSALRARVVDGSGKPVPGVYFIAQGRQQIAPCVVGESRTFELEAGVGCDGEYELSLGAGTFTVEVRADGYASQTLEVTLPEPEGCCGPGKIEKRTVTLAR